MAYWNDWNQHRFEPSIALSPASRPSTATWISRGHREGGDDWKSTDHIDACEFHHLPKRSEAYRDVRVGVNDGGDFQHIQLDQGQDSRSARLRVAAVRWAPEIAWLVVGYLCLVVVITSMALFDGRSPPQWPLGITLNTLVALFTTFSRMAFMAPVIEGIGQLKWTWFINGDKPQPLIDFQILDDASRGQWGSLVVLAKMKGFLACLGAAITLSGLLTSTITQQAIEYPTIRAVIPNGTASIGVTKRVSLWDGNGLALGHGETIREKRAILDGAFMVPSDIFPHTAPICSSGDCDWLPYGTLAICSEVVNLTNAAQPDMLKQLRALAAGRLSVLVNSTHSLINELTHGLGTAPAIGPVFPIVSLGLPFPTGALNDSIKGLITGDAFVAFSNTPINIFQPITDDIMSRFQFLEVAFYWCAKSFTTTVKDGIPSTTEISSRTHVLNSTSVGLNFAWSGMYYDCYLSGTCNQTIGGWRSVIEGPTELPIRESYEIDSWTALTASALLGLAMYDAIFVDQFRGMVSSSGGGTAEAFASALVGEFLATELPAPEAQFGAVRNISSNMARSMTNFLRSLSYHGDSGPQAANGTAYSLQTFIRVRWAWIAMLAAQLFLTSLFLVSVLIETWIARVQILKGSTLATMCALDSAARNAVGGIGQLAELDKRAKSLGVALDHVSGQDLLRLSPCGRQT